MVEFFFVKSILLVIEIIKSVFVAIIASFISLP
jgi:hypothetical protein